MRTRSGGYRSRMGVRVLLALAITFPATGCGEGAVGPEAAPDEVESEVLAAMTEAIQDEYRAEVIYLGVMDDFGEVRPFTNIVYAEVRHSDALALLFQARGLQSLPVSGKRMSFRPSTHSQRRVRQGSRPKTITRRITRSTSAWISRRTSAGYLKTTRQPR